MFENQLPLDWQLASRRSWLQSSAGWLGATALASLNADNASRAAESQPQIVDKSLLPHFAAKAKRVIYLFQSGAPSQLGPSRSACASCTPPEPPPASPAMCPTSTGS